MTENEGLMVKALARSETAAADEAEAIGKMIAEGLYKQALERCAKAYASLLGRLCMVLIGSQAEAEELAQETLLAAYDAFPSFRFESSVRS